MIRMFDQKLTNSGGKVDWGRVLINELNSLSEFGGTGVSAIRLPASSLRADIVVNSA